MPLKPKSIFVLALGLAGGLALYPSRAQVATAPADAAQMEHARRPISYFNAECGNCHGDYGSFWGEGFAAELSDEQLHKIVDEMAAGPAQAPLKGIALEVQVAYHRSLVDQKPFIVAWKGEDGIWQGEVTPGSTVTLGGDAAKVEGHTWKAGADTEAVRVKKGDQETVLSLEKSSAGVAYSHAKPHPATQPAR